MIVWKAQLDIVTNKREHWAATHRRNKKNARVLKKLWMVEKDKPTAPCLIIIERLYNPSLKQKKMDDDNFIAGCKGIRDCIADLIIPNLAAGRADEEKRGLQFCYQQTAAKESATLIKFFIGNRSRNS